MILVLPREGTNVKARDKAAAAQEYRRQKKAAKEKTHV